MLLAPAGSHARLGGGAVGFTDGDGIATLHLVAEAGASGEYSLLIGSRGTIRGDLAAEVRRAYSVLAPTLTAWGDALGPVAQTAEDVATMVKDGTWKDLLQRHAARASKSGARPGGRRRLGTPRGPRRRPLMGHD